MGVVTQKDNIGGEISGFYSPHKLTGY